MINPAKFVTAEFFTKVVSKKAFIKFGDRIKWNVDGKDTLLDIGCGPGNILNDVIVPEMPSFSTSMVYGMDKSKEMIDYCSKTYANVPNMKFIEMDILQLEDFVDSYGRVDHVTAFLLFHCFREHKKPLENVRKVLKPNGEFICTIFGNFVQLNMFEIMGSHPKWNQYLGNVEELNSPYFKSPHPDKDFEKALEEAGFKDIEMDFTKDQQIVFEEKFSYNEIIKSVTPNIKNIPEDRLEEYLEDAFDIGVKEGLIKMDAGTGFIHLDYNIITAFCRNP